MYLNGVELMKLGRDAMVRQEVFDCRAELLLVLLVPQRTGSSAVDSFRAMFLDFQAVLLDEERVHLRTQPDELDDRLAECFVFELADHLVVRRVVEGTRPVVGGEVEVHAVREELLVEVGRLNPVHE